MGETRVHDKILRMVVEFIWGTAHLVRSGWTRHRPQLVGLLLVIVSGAVALHVLGLTASGGNGAHTLFIDAPCEDVMPNVGLFVENGGRDLRVEIDLMNHGQGDPWRPTAYAGRCSGVRVMLPEAATDPVLMVTPLNPVGGDDPREVGEWIPAESVRQGSRQQIEVPLALRERFFGVVGFHLRGGLGSIGFAQRSVFLAITYGWQPDNLSAPISVLVPPTFSLDESRTLPKPQAVFPMVQGEALFLSEVTLRKGREGEPYLPSVYGSIKLTVVDDFRAEVGQYALFVAAALFGFGIGLVLQPWSGLPAAEGSGRVAS